MNKEQNEIWFITGSQHLYGDEALQEVERHSKKIAEGLSDSLAGGIR